MHRLSAKLLCRMEACSTNRTTCRFMPLLAERMDVSLAMSSPASSSSASPQTVQSHSQVAEQARLNRHNGQESPSHREVVHYCKLATYKFEPQRWRLCANPTTAYQTRPGLSDHATVHHGHWYSSHDDTFVPIRFGLWNGSVPRFVTARCTGATIATRLTLFLLMRLAPSNLVEITPRGVVAVSLLLRIWFNRTPLLPAPFVGRDLCGCGFRHFSSCHRPCMGMCRHRSFQKPLWFCPTGWPAFLRLVVRYWSRLCTTTLILGWSPR